MSLILDALRKSEAERRRGQAPDLFGVSAANTPMLSARDPRLPWIIAAAALLLVVAVSYWQWQRSTPTTGEVPVAVTSSAASNLPDNASMATATPVKPPAAATVAAPAAATTKPSSPPKPVETNQAPMPGNTSSANAANTMGSGAMDTDIAAPPAAAAADNTAEQALPTLAALAAARRATLPPLKLSMHVWSQTPEKRFAIVDGQRVSEGGLLGDTMVQEIRRDGVVLVVDGERYLLPRP